MYVIIRLYSSFSDSSSDYIDVYETNPMRLLGAYRSMAKFDKPTKIQSTATSDEMQINKIFGGSRACVY